MKGRAGRNCARAFYRRNQQGRYGPILGPINGLGRSLSYLNKIFRAGLGGPFSGRARRRIYVLCTVFTLMEFFLVMENGKLGLDRKSLVGINT